MINISVAMKMAIVPSLINEGLPNSLLQPGMVKDPMVRSLRNTSSTAKSRNRKRIHFCS